MINYYKKINEEKSKEARGIMSEYEFDKCREIIHDASILAGVAGAIPIPIADAIPISAAQITMVISLGNVFGEKIEESVAKSMVTVVATTFIGRQIVKFIPIIGWGFSGIVAAGITEAVGWIIAMDLVKSKKMKYDKEINEIKKGVYLNNKHEDIEESLKECLNKPMYIRKEIRNIEENVLDLSEQDLLDGEVCAHVFEIGCYKIRSARRLYLRGVDGRVPAGEELVKNYKEKNFRYNLLGNEVFEGFGYISDEVFSVNEISAKPINNTTDEWKTVCSVESGGGWIETLKIIATVSENSSTDESDDSLVILKEWVGITYTSYYWHILKSDGTFKVYSKGAFDDTFKECDGIIHSVHF